MEDTKRMGFIKVMTRGWTVIQRILVIVAVVAFLAVLHRFADLYQVSVQAETVHANIAMERHKMFLREITQQQTAVELPSLDEDAPDVVRGPEASGNE